MDKNPIRPGAPFVIPPEPRLDQLCFSPGFRGDAVPLRTLMAEKERRMKEYSRLLRRLPPDDARIAEAVMREEHAHLKRLQKAYMLISGEEYIPIVPDPPKEADLRACVLGELRLSGDCSAFARASADRCARSLFADIAADDRQHAQWLLVLLR